MYFSSFALLFLIEKISLPFYKQKGRGFVSIIIIKHNKSIPIASFTRLEVTGILLRLELIYLNKVINMLVLRLKNNLAV